MAMVEREGFALLIMYIVMSHRQRIYLLDIRHFSTDALGGICVIISNNFRLFSCLENVQILVQVPFGQTFLIVRWD